MLSMAAALSSKMIFCASRLALAPLVVTPTVLTRRPAAASSDFGAAGKHALPQHRSQLQRIAVVAHAAGVAGDSETVLRPRAGR